MNPQPDDIIEDEDDVEGHFARDIEGPDDEDTEGHFARD
jgi:hypothetical protein